LTPPLVSSPRLPDRPLRLTTAKWYKQALSIHPHTPWEYPFPGGFPAGVSARAAGKPAAGWHGSLPELIRLALGERDSRNRQMNLFLRQ